MKTPTHFAAVIPLVLILAASSALATTYYVNGTNGSDSWNGLAPAWDGANGPKKTIQGGVDACNAGSTVQIAAGIYTGSSNVNIGIGKAMTIQSETGPSTTIVDGNNAGPVFNLSDGPVSIAGLTITHGQCAVNTDHAPTLISNCVFLNNSSTRGALFSHPSVEILSFLRMATVR